jgi:5-methylcytosine-specific restriction protein B
MKTDRIWKVIPTHWKARNLLGFALFGDEQQELSLFAPYAFATASEEYSEEEESPEGRSASTPYSVEDIVSDGCFIPQSILEGYLDRLQTKKNIILQGPPGTGKTWLAKKLGFALIGSLDEQLMTRVQFHPNLSYEDFIRGWRPKGDGKLELADGPLMNTVDAALSRPGIPHVLVIEEINRGNPAQIFGEMLTLLEVDKRSSSESLKLSYSRTPSERVYVPDNLYLIGTMNIADRSLALVDLALRRRFAFLDLVPQFNSAWSDWAKEHGSLTTEFVNDIRSRISALNDEIAASNVLGAQFVVGHSYLTPHENTPITDANEWFRQVVTTEIGPLLEEYWFDQPKTAEEQTKLLLEGI